MESQSAHLIDGSTYYLDVLFRGIRLVIEIDGRRYHSGSDVFESDRKRQNLLVLHGWRVLRITGRMHHIGNELFEADRWRQNLLVLDGWCVLRFTWAMLGEIPERSASVRSALAMLARRHTGASSGSSIAAANWEL